VSEGRALLAGKSVLLVEDEPLILMDSEAMLKSLGAAKVSLARNVAEGLQALDNERPSLAILDYRLKGENSLPLARRLAELGVRFGFLTGYEGDGIPREFRDRPLLAKPFTAAQLLGLLRTLTGQMTDKL
jgi:CheY-like chemotaxis protein